MCVSLTIFITNVNGSVVVISSVLCLLSMHGIWDRIFMYEKGVTDLGHLPQKNICYELNIKLAWVIYCKEDPAKVCRDKFKHFSSQHTC